MGYPATLKKTFKMCTKCGDDVPLEGFFRCKDGKDGYMSECKKCNLKRRKEHFLSPIGQKKYNVSRLKRKYGITLAEYGTMLEAQCGVCAICGLPETETNSIGTKWLSVDHDHKTNKVRGLLCGKCNQALGCFKDNKDIMLSAILYLGDK